jgi:hypothetical protein
MAIDSEILSYVNKLVEGTMNHKVTWQLVNPSTAVWTNVDAAARIAIQKLSGSAMLLQVADVRGGTVKFNLDSRAMPQALGLLQRLFSLAEQQVARESLDFFKSALPD